MKKPLKQGIKAVLFSLPLFPGLARAVTYNSDGAILLGESQQPTTNNLVAAIGGSDLSLSCLGIAALMFATIYILHQLWQPKRSYKERTNQEKQRDGAIFYVGGSLVWMMIAVMAESWCLVLPLATILAGSLIWYAAVVVSAPQTNSPQQS